MSNKTENNKIIAEWMGAVYSENAEAWAFGNVKNIGSMMFQGVMYHNVISAEIFEKELKYDSSWDSLIPVLKKINLLGVDLSSWRMITHPLDYDIEKVCKQAAEFIKQYKTK